MRDICVRNLFESDNFAIESFDAAAGPNSFRKLIALRLETLTLELNLTEWEINFLGFSRRNGVRLFIVSLLEPSIIVQVRSSRFCRAQVSIGRLDPAFSLCSPPVDLFYSRERC